MRCPWCFEWTDQSAKGCARCGAASEPPAADAKTPVCPSCRVDLATRALGGARLAGCASCSGVILDACKPHGVWFDADELRRIVAFIRGGGLDVARGLERDSLESARRGLERAALDARAAMNVTGFSAPLVPAHITSAAGLLAHLLGFED